MSVEELKERSRLALHMRLGRPAFYYASPGDAEPEYVETTVREHLKMGAVGEMAGTSFAYAEQADVQEKLVFLVSEVPSPARNGLVVIDEDTGYWIDAVEPPHGITRKATVRRATAGELVPFSYPV